MRRVQPLASGPLSLNRYCDAWHLLVSFSGRPFGFTLKRWRGLDTNADRHHGKLVFFDRQSGGPL